MSRQYHSIHKEVPPRASPSRSIVFRMAFLHHFFTVMAESHKTLQAVIWDTVSVRRSGACEPGEGFVKVCRVKEKNVLEQEESNARAQDDAYGTGVMV